jgi:outer membrane lipoprotein SlyB
MRMHAIGVIVAATLAGAGCARQASVESGSAPMPEARPSTGRSMPIGTTLHARLDDSLGTDRSKVGDRFTATVTTAVTADNGETVVPAGATVHGTVTGLDNSDRAGDNAYIRLDFERLSFGGRDYAFDADVVATDLQTQGDTRNETIKKAGIGAAAGAVLGAVLGDADLKNIVLGAAIGAAAGTVISLGSGDVEAVLPAGSDLTLRSTELVSMR